LLVNGNTAVASRQVPQWLTQLRADFKTRKLTMAEIERMAKFERRYALPAEPTPEPEPVPIKDAWGQFMTDLGDRNGGWDWWVTLTFKPTVPRYRERTERSGLLYEGKTHKVLVTPGHDKPGWGYTGKAWDRFVTECGLRKGLHDVRWVRGREYQTWRGVPHFHGLLAGVAGLHRLSMMDWWFEHYGIARIEPYDRTRGAGFYLCKYVTKELGDIQFSGGLTMLAHVIK